MNCPECGARLQWHEGAFCDQCMIIAKEKIRIKKEQEKENASTPAGKEGR